MRCTEFENRLNSRLDDRQRPELDPLLATHAAQCDDCRQLMSLQMATLAGLSRRNVPPLSRDFAQRVVAAANRNAPAVVTRTSSTRAWLAVGAVLTSAAMMLLAVSLVRFARRGDAVVAGGNATRNTNLEKNRRQTSGLAIAQPKIGRRKAAAKPSEMMSGADLLIAAPRLPAHLREYRGAIDDFVVSLPAAASRLEEMERVAPGIRPLRASFSIIWETLSLSIPAAETKLGPGEAPTKGSGPSSSSLLPASQLFAASVA